MSRDSNPNFAMAGRVWQMNPESRGHGGEWESGRRRRRRRTEVVGDFDVRLDEWCVDARSLHLMHLSERVPASCLCTGHKNAQVDAGVEHTTRGACATQLTAGARYCKKCKKASNPEAVA